MKIFATAALLMLSSLAVASSGSRDVVPMPIEPDLSTRAPLKAKEVPMPEDSAASEGERQYIHNANREALIKNWKVKFAWNENGYIGKYEHVNGDRGMFLKFEKEIPGVTTALDTLKIFMERYHCDRKTLKIYSETFASAETLISPEKEKNPGNTMRIYLSKEKPGDGYTVIFVMGTVSDTDFKMVLEDFFLNISNKNHGLMREVAPEKNDQPQKDAPAEKK